MLIEQDEDPRGGFLQISKATDEISVPQTLLLVDIQ